MSKEQPEEWRLQIKCPYCNAVVAESPDLLSLGEYFDDDEVAQNTVIDANLDTEGTPCEHTAFYGDANADTLVIPDEWTKEMIEIALAVSKLTDVYEYDEEEIDDDAALSILTEEFSVIFDEDDIAASTLTKALTKRYGKNNFSVYSNKLGGDYNYAPFFNFIFIKNK